MVRAWMTEVGQQEQLPNAQERPAGPQKAATRSRHRGKNNCYILFIKFNIDK
jgi:hypothetical protein